MSSAPCPCVATLIAPEAGGEWSGLLADASVALQAVENPVWLDPGRAVDLPFATDDLSHARHAIDALCRPRGLDGVVQPRAHRRKKLLLADMDSTMIGQECIDELADFAGLKPQVAAITERAMRGELAFEPALRERVALLKDLPREIIDRVIAERLTLTPGGAALVQTMRAHSAYTCLVSGGFTLFTGPMAARLGFDEHRGNSLMESDGRLSGRVGEPILGKAAKRAALLALRDRLGLDPAETLAIGDGANDLAMIAEAGLGVAFHAKPAVAAAAAARIDHCDLTALLFAQGYDRRHFAPT